MGWTKPGSLADGRIDEGDVLAWQAQVRQCYATGGAGARYLGFTGTDACDAYARDQQMFELQRHMAVMQGFQAMNTIRR